MDMNPNDGSRTSKRNVGAPSAAEAMMAAAQSSALVRTVACFTIISWLWEANSICIHPFGSKMVSIRSLNRAAIVNASGRLGSYLPVSIALTVCRDTFSRSASSACD